MRAAALFPRESERLQALADAALLDTPPEQMFDDIVRLASHICETPIALLSLVDRDRQWFKAKVGLAAQQTPRDVAFCAHAILTPEMLEVEDAHADERFADNPLVTGDPGVRFYAGIPLMYGGGLPLGTLCAIDRVPRKLTPQQAEAMQALARQVEANIELRQAIRRTARLNEELRRTGRALHDSETKTEALLAASPDGMIRVHRDGTVLDRKVGRDHAILPVAGEMIGRKVVDCFPPRLARLFMLHLERAVGTEAIERFEYEDIAGGEPCEKEIRIVATGPDEALAIVRDVTERKLGERAKDEFVATVSHELRTPLTSIRGSLSLLENGLVGPVADEALELVQIARQNAERLLLVINDILDLEKLSSGKLDLVLRTIEPRRLLVSALQSIQGMAELAGIKLAMTACTDGPVLGDEGRLIQVLNNLLSNAIKFSSRGDTVELSARAGAPGRTRFAVCDRGRGIAAEHHARVFERFRQVDASDRRERGGTGLGLAIVKSIVEEHGGLVGLDSAPGHGSTFWFELRDADAAPEQP